MTIEQVTTLATFGAVWAVLAVGHNLTDHVFGQSDQQVANKGAPSAAEVTDGVNPRRGWGTCLGHVAQYRPVDVDSHCDASSLHRDVASGRPGRRLRAHGVLALADRIVDR
ncbi:hypothetical protein [Streptomyces acidicola]|uniref:hypothetical protein n=1 Tax=Streptomyces acidicola TaxID=2596892 RepID=UPI0037FEA6F0